MADIGQQTHASAQAAWPADALDIVLLPGGALTEDASIADKNRVLVVAPNQKAITWSTVDVITDFVSATLVGSMVAIAPNESLAATTKPCLHAFFARDDSLFIVDGLIALKENGGRLSEVTHRPIIWPELHAALSLMPMDFKSLVSKRVNEPGYLRIKNLAEDNYASKLPPLDAEAYGLRAIYLLHAWNRWVDGDTSLYNRAEELDHAKFGSNAPGKVPESAADRLRKTLLPRLKLVLDRRIDFDNPWRQLLAALRSANTIHKRMWPRR